MRITLSLPKDRALLDATNNDDDDDDRSLELDEVPILRQSSSRTLGSSRHSNGSIANGSWSSSWHSSSTRVLNNVKQSVQKIRRPNHRTISVKSMDGGTDLSPKRYCEFTDSINEFGLGIDEISTMKISGHTGTTASSESVDPSSHKSESDEEYGNEGAMTSPHRSFNTSLAKGIVGSCMQLNLNEHHTMSPLEFTVTRPAWISPHRDNPKGKAAFPSLSQACELEMEFRRNLRRTSMEFVPQVVEQASRRSSLNHHIALGSPPRALEQNNPPKNVLATSGEDFAFDAPKPASFRRTRADLHRTPRRNVERRLPPRETPGEQITLNASWHTLQRPSHELERVRHVSPRRRAVHPDIVLSRVMATPRHSTPRGVRPSPHGWDMGRHTNRNIANEHVTNSMARTNDGMGLEMERISPRRSTGFYSKRERVQFDFNPKDIKDLSKSVHPQPNAKMTALTLKTPAVYITKPLVDLQSENPAVSLDVPDIC